VPLQVAEASAPVDANNAYWVDYGSGLANDGEILQTPK
jgi:hypothetical protein